MLGTLYETIFEATYNAEEINIIAKKIIKLLKVSFNQYNNKINNDEVSGKVNNKIQSKIVLLYGELGAGKTTLTQALISQLLGETIYVSSPTFNINNIYSGQAELNDKKINTINIAHFDLYRIKNIRELYELGIDDLLRDNDFSIIEWPALIEEKLLMEMKNCSMVHYNKNHNNFNLKYNEKKHNKNTLSFLKINLTETEEPERRIIKIEKIKEF